MKSNLLPRGSCVNLRIGNGGLLTPNTVALTPDASFNSVQKQRTALHAFVNTLKGTVPVNDLLEFQVANGDAFVVPTFINVDSKTVNFLGGNSRLPGRPVFSTDAALEPPPRFRSVRKQRPNELME